MLGGRGGEEDIDFGRKHSGGNQTKLTQYPVLERTCARARGKEMKMSGATKKGQNSLRFFRPPKTATDK